MPKKIRKITRRNFLKTAGLAGLGTIIAPLHDTAGAADKLQTMPTRPFGNFEMQPLDFAFQGRTRRPSMHLTAGRADRRLRPMVCASRVAARRIDTRMRKRKRSDWLPRQQTRRIGA